MMTAVISKNRVLNIVVFRLVLWPRIKVPWIEQAGFGQRISLEDDESQNLVEGDEGLFAWK